MNINKLMATIIIASVAIILLYIFYLFTFPILEIIKILVIVFIAYVIIPCLIFWSISEITGNENW